EELLILLGERVLRLREDGDEIFLGQILERRDDRQAADELGDQTELRQILGLALLQHGADRLRLPRFDRRAEADAALADAASDDLIDPHERAAADEQDVRRVDLHVLLLRVLLRPARSDAALRALED